MDILNDRKARKMRDDGATYRKIADETKTTLDEVRDLLRRRNLRSVQPVSNVRDRAHDELRQEINDAGGLKTWWELKP